MVSLSSDRLGWGLLLLPYLCGVLLLVIIPVVMTFGLSLFQYDLIRPAQWIGVANFRDLMGDDVFATALRNSLQFIVWSVPLRIAIMLGLALLLHARFFGARAARSSVFLPTIIPDAAYALVWLWLLNPLYGPINLLLTSLGMSPVPWLTDAGATQAAVVMMSLFQIGEGFFILLAARRLIAPKLYDQLELEGASRWQSFRWLTWPFIAPLLLLLILRDTVFSLQATFVPALLVTGGGPPPYATTYIPTFIYDQAFEYLRYGYAAAATVVVFVLTALIVLAQYLILRRMQGKWRM